MKAVVSALDPASHDAVCHLWAGIATEFGIRMPFDQPVPHFTYHVAAAYDEMRLRDVLWHVSRDHGPFRVRAGGLGLFTGAKLVAHVPLVRNRALNTVQRDLWRDLDGVGTEVVPHFNPEQWIPHLTLAYAGLTRELLPSLVTWLADRSFSWDIEVDHLGVIAFTSDGEAIEHQFPLVGSRS